MIEEVVGAARAVEGLKRDYQDMMEREATKRAAQFEYLTRWVHDDPQEHINAIASNGWRLHSIVCVGTNERENHINHGSICFVIVMEREVRR